MENPVSAATKRKRSSWLSALGGSAAPRLRWQWGMALAALALLVVGGWLAFENAQLRRQMAQMQAKRDMLAQREQELQKELEGERSAGTQTSQELAQARAQREQLAQELQQRDAQESQRADAQQHSKSSGGISIASFILAPQMRGGGQITTITIPPQTDYVAVRLELEPNEYQAYRVALLDSASRYTLWRSGKLKASTTGTDKTLSVSFRAGLLKQQTYVLQVEGVAGAAAAEIVDDYPFRVVK